MATGSRDPRATEVASSSFAGTAAPSFAGIAIPNFAEQAVGGITVPN